METSIIWDDLTILWCNCNDVMVSANNFGNANACYNTRGTTKYSSTYITMRCLKLCFEYPENMFSNGLSGLYCQMNLSRHYVGVVIFRRILTRITEDILFSHSPYALFWAFPKTFITLEESVKGAHHCNDAYESFELVLTGKPIWYNHAIIFYHAYTGKCYVWVGLVFLIETMFLVVIDYIFHVTGHEYRRE